ncbi:PKD domain-containing protein [Aquimarina sp. BL5]|uniref:glycosyl hydrolase family 8 n=1 Tax=Aquimarina sp. BL5 TaxID=1714860 RepID=UPI000E495741|nr:glycosyl hydrolase family 8 [Aquimarina sp. BL5]AXT53263.1 PKD domain-containing protein [Aquimarina sp. BL5]RKN02824.1 PKD domain-containing protein [Aquimarina sp. BL5]
MKNLKTDSIRFVTFCSIALLILLQYTAYGQNTIRVENGKIFTSCSEEIVMRGVNEMFVWSQDRTGEQILPEIAKTGSNAVRLVWTTEGAETELDLLINNSIKNSMIPVAELHDATGDFSKLQLLLDYWKRPAILATIQKYKKWLIVNIGNEVGNGSESTAQWVNYYKDAITQLRDAGIDTPLMIDCGGYGNRESYFLEGGNELLEFDPLHNIIFAVHTYWTNGDDQAKIDRLNLMIADAKTKKLPYIIGEGPQKVASPIACGQNFPYVEMMKRLQEEKIGWLSWSWGAVDNNDCGSPNSDLDITTDGKYGNWATNFAQEMSLTDINSIKNTSIIPPSMLDPGIAACGVTYTISATTNLGGSISPSGDIIVSEGDNQIFDIASTIGFKIGDVLVDGASVGDLETFTFSNVTANHTIEVVFEDVPLPPQVPYVNGQPQPIPGKINATSFDLGGEVVAYHDTTPGNDGDGVRPEEDVDTELEGDGGNIGFTADGEWVEYTVNVAQAGTYSIDVLVASAVSNGAYHIEFDGVDVTGIQNVATTGGWTNYIPQKIPNVTLSAGEQVMRVFMDEGAFNYSTMTFTLDGGTGNNPPEASFTATPESGNAPLEVRFDASISSDPDGDVLTYAWDFGNGQTSTLENPTVTFTEIQSYTVNLTVNDGNGNMSSAEKIISVNDPNVRPAPVIPDQPSFTSGIYRNMFVESGKNEIEVQDKLDQIWNQYFVNGDPNSEKLFFEVGTDMAYILDTGNEDIRSEGMSYGMMICVQLDKKEAFDKLWKFAKTYSQHKPGTAKEGIFSWQLSTTDFSMIDSNPAPDGEEYFITALFFADARWGSETGTGAFDSETDIFDYRAQANYILDNMINKASADSGQCPTNLVDLKENQIVFTPCGTSATFTDPSYHLAGFYEIWAMYADNNNALWTDMATTSRTYLLPRAAHPITGLIPDYSEFDGRPKEVGTHANFEFDAWRNIMNMGFDFAWFQKNKADIQPIINRQIDFFKDKPNYPGLWTLDGTARNTDHNPGLVACNAVGSLALEDAKVWPFVDELFELNPPSGRFRYYDGLLYMMSYMHVAGTYKIYKPTANNTTPVASFTSSVNGGVAPLEVTFDGSASTDPNGGTLTYAWDLGNGISATTVAASNIYDVGTYIITLTVMNATGESDSVSRTVTVTDGNVSCTFDTPIATPLPSVNTSFENVFVLGTGGPSLDNITKFEINWDLDNNGLYQFSISTNDGAPNWWNDLLPNVTQNLNTAQPEITITNSGFPDLDGAYWVTIDNGNFVLVSKTKGFTIYFSKTVTAPNCDGGSTDPDPVVNGGTITGGPFTFTVGDGISDMVSGVTLTDNIGTNSQWVVTDDQNNILGLPATIEAVDFDEAGIGNCLIWHLSYENGIQGLAVNNNVTALTGDFDLSNSLSVFRNPVDTGEGDCNFDTPFAEPLPNISKTFTNIFVLGTGGPNLDNIKDFGINWNLDNNGLYQLSMSTTNGSPSWWIDFLPIVTQNFGQPQPSITITASGIQNLDGTYWVSLDTGNFVLVSTSGDYTIYCSNSGTAPDCGNVVRESGANDITGAKVFPNPVTDQLIIKTKNPLNDAIISIIDITGRTIKTVSVQSKVNEVSLEMIDLKSGVYFVKLYHNKQIKIKQIIKR